MTRTISNLDDVLDELDALPDDAIIRTAGGITYEKYKHWHALNVDGWLRPGYDWPERIMHFVDPIHLPLTVIWEGEK